MSYLSKNESLVSGCLRGDYDQGVLSGLSDNRLMSYLSKNESLVSGCLSGDYDQGVQSGLSDKLMSYLSKSVVSITLYNGDTTLFSCSGIAMECHGRHLTRFLTSASLVSALNDTNEDHDDLKIEVRHEGPEVYMGVMSEVNLDHNFAVVNVHKFLDVQVGSFQHALHIVPVDEILVLIGRHASGEIVARNVEFDGDSRVSEDDEDLDHKISEAWEGGLLISFEGNFVGMNLFLTTRRAVYLPWVTILNHLEQYWTSQQKKTGLARSSKVYRFGAIPICETSKSHPGAHGDVLNQEQLDLDYMGYPKLPSSSPAGMILVNKFEETFGDIYAKGVWRKLSKRASNLNRNVVALASFNGEKRFFACTGSFIEWNGSTILLTSASLVRDSADGKTINGNLRIKVLHNSQCREGKLEHCNLHYNVAVVSVENCRVRRPLNTLLRLDKGCEVAAIGRCFHSGALMATTGQLVSWTGTLDCNFLSTSTCKITKAGIGGPLVSLDGDIIGMNFYDKRIGTPFLDWDTIYEILTSFETESKPGDDIVSLWKMDKDDNTELNRWPVPMPRWCTPDYSEDKSDDDDLADPGSCCHRYRYLKGKKIFFAAAPARSSP